MLMVMTTEQQYRDRVKDAREKAETAEDETTWQTWVDIAKGLEALPTSRGKRLACPEGKQEEIADHTRGKPVFSNGGSCRRERWNPLTQPAPGASQASVLLQGKRHAPVGSLPRVGLGRSFNLTLDLADLAAMRPCRAKREAAVTILRPDSGGE